MTRKKIPTLAASTQLQVISRSIAELKPNPNNPRKHSKKQCRQIANSIEAFGFSVPVLVDGQSQIIAGHGRVAACKLLGWTEVPTISLAHLTPDQATALLLADNRLTDTSGWDDQMLAKMLEELSTADLAFSIEATGFDMGEIDWRVAEAFGPAEEVDDADEIPKVEAVAISCLGDVWEAGRHRIICGNSLEAPVLDALLEGARVRMVFADPPYNVRIDGHASGLGRHRHREFPMASGEMTPARFAAFMAAALAASAGRLVDGGIAFTCIDWRHVADVVAAVTASDGELKNICVWAKHNPGMGSLYRSGHELIVVSKHGTAPHVNNVELGRHGRNRSNLWRYPGANSPGVKRGREGDLLALHPTPKPVALVADAILDCSDRNDIVLDTFLGSGTTIIAAERTGRRGYGVELDPLYVDTAIRRYQKMTGQVVRHHVTGEAFNQRSETLAIHKGADHG